MRDSEVLIRARDLLTTSGMCRYTLAVSTDGEWCDPTLPDATRFCSAGAIHAVLGIPDGEQPTVVERYYALITQAAGAAARVAKGIGSWHDYSTDEGVLAVWDRAIAAALEREAAEAAPTERELVSA